MAEKKAKKYDADIIGWYTRGGKRIPIRKGTPQGQVAKARNVTRIEDTHAVSPAKNLKRAYKNEELTDIQRKMDDLRYKKEPRTAEDEKEYSRLRREKHDIQKTDSRRTHKRYVKGFGGMEDRHSKEELGYFTRGGKRIPITAGNRREAMEHKALIEKELTEHRKKYGSWNGKENDKLEKRLVNHYGYTPKEASLMVEQGTPSVWAVYPAPPEAKRKARELEAHIDYLASKETLTDRQKRDLKRSRRELKNK